ncbi:TPA: hypothetical protein O6A36_002750 [Staphylococcus aureus]|nr:hypothetical protein [Staphylococcus aureus]
MVLIYFFANGNEYHFKGNDDFWGYIQIKVIENNEFIGFINERYNVDEAKEMIENRKNFKQKLLINRK